MLDVTRYCSYREQIFIPPPAKTVSPFAGKPESWSLIGTKEQCLTTIAKQGAALFDDMSFCDTDMKALSGCCESVFGALTCVGETASAKGIGDETSLFASMTADAAQMLELFSEYCVPLCQNTKEEFCGKFPGADVCVSHSSCETCTGQGGLWCPKLKSCHCPGPKPPCIAPPIMTPLKCVHVAADKPKKKRRMNAFKPVAKQAVGGSAPGSSAPGDAAGRNALCKYAEMASKWK
jgi:hypothetical protein